MFFFVTEIVGVILKRLNFINPFASKIVKLPAELKGLKTTPPKNTKQWKTIKVKDLHSDNNGLPFKV